jgi:hypothetical protein
MTGETTSRRGGSTTCSGASATCGRSGPRFTSCPRSGTGRDTLYSAPLRIDDRSGIWVATLHAGADLSEANLLYIRVALAARDDATR